MAAPARFELTTYRLGVCLLVIDYLAYYCSLLRKSNMISLT